MTCIRTGGDTFARGAAIITSFSEPADYRITDGTRVWFFDWSDRFGPSLTNGRGTILANPFPAEKSLFWRCFGLWLAQGNRWESADGTGGAQLRKAVWNEPPIATYVIDGALIVSTDEPDGFHDQYSQKRYVDRDGNPAVLPRVRKPRARKLTISLGNL